MTKRKIALLSTLLVLSIGGIATGTAFIIQSANKTKSDAADSAMILSWGENQTFSEITELKAGTYQYRSVSLKAPLKSAGVTDTAQLTITLSDSASGKMDGLVVDVSTSDWTKTESISSYDTLDATTKTKSFTVTVATTYYLRVSITQEAYSGYIAEGATTTFGATINLSYEKVAATNA